MLRIRQGFGVSLVLSSPLSASVGVNSTTGFHLGSLVLPVDWLGRPKTVQSLLRAYLKRDPLELTIFAASLFTLFSVTCLVSY